MVNLIDNSSTLTPTLCRRCPSTCPDRSPVRATALNAGAKPLSGQPDLDGDRLPQIGASLPWPSTENGAGLEARYSAPASTILAAVSPVPRGRLFDFSTGPPRVAPQSPGGALYSGTKPGGPCGEVAMDYHDRPLKNPDGSLNRDYYAQGPATRGPATCSTRADLHSGSRTGSASSGAG